MPDSNLPTTLLRTCRLQGCQAKFPVPRAAKNKEFCSAEHRQEFHAEQRRRAMELLRAQEQEPGQ